MVFCDPLFPALFYFTKLNNKLQVNKLMQNDTKIHIDLEKYEGL